MKLLTMFWVLWVFTFSRMSIQDNRGCATIKIWIFARQTCVEWIIIIFFIKFVKWRLRWKARMMRFSIDGCKRFRNRVWVINYNFRNCWFIKLYIKYIFECIISVLFLKTKLITCYGLTIIRRLWTPSVSVVQCYGRNSFTRRERTIQ